MPETDALKDFVRVASIYVAERMSIRDTEWHGYAHAHSVAEAAQFHARIVSSLRRAFAALPTDRPDYVSMKALVETAAFGRSGIITPEHNRIVEDALSHAGLRPPVAETAPERPAKQYPAAHSPYDGLLVLTPFDT